MGRVDVLTKNYMKNKRVFADAFNYYVYDGEQVIDPNKLREVDASAVTVPYGEDETGIKTQPIQKIRDTFCSVMADDDMVYMLLGIENQGEVHYAMPVKTMLYDAMEYVSQIQEAARAHSKAKNYGSGAEFLSGFHKDDRLLPVITLVIYWGDGEWTEPRCLHDMMNIKNKTALRFISNYEINLIIPNELNDEEIEKFSSDLGKALMYIKNMRNPSEIKKMITDDRYRSLESETGILLSEVMNFEYHLPKREEVTDMCYAFEVLVKEAAEEAAIKASREAAILTTIETCREFDMAEADIERKIMGKFEISEEEAREYMLGKSA